MKLGATALGAAAGWAGGWTDRIVSRVVDTIMGFPLFVLAVGIAAGMASCLVLTGDANRERLAASGLAPTLVLERIDGLLDQSR